MPVVRMPIRWGVKGGDDKPEESGNHNVRII